MQVCTLLQTENHTSTPPLCFLQAGCPSCRPTNSVKALKANHPRHSLQQMPQSTNYTKASLPNLYNCLFSFRRQLTTWQCSHLLLRRSCCWAPGSKQSISPAHWAHNSRVGRTNGTDRRTPYHCIDLALRAKHAVPIWYEIRTAVVFNNQLQVVMH